jgi:hypothetical protein
MASAAHDGAEEESLRKGDPSSRVASSKEERRSPAAVERVAMIGNR